MPAGLRGDHRLLNTRQKLLRLGQRQPQMRDIAKVAGRPDLHDAIPGPGLSVSVSTNRKTHPIRDLPAGNGPTGHIACVLIPRLSGHSPSARHARYDARRIGHCHLRRPPHVGAAVVESTSMSAPWKPESAGRFQPFFHRISWTLVAPFMDCDGATRGNPLDSDGPS